MYWILIKYEKLRCNNGQFNNIVKWKHATAAVKEHNLFVRCVVVVVLQMKRWMYCKLITSKGRKEKLYDADSIKNAAIDNEWFYEFNITKNIWFHLSVSFTSWIIFYDKTKIHYSKIFNARISNISH